MKYTDNAAVTNQTALTDSPRPNARAANENAPTMASRGQKTTDTSLFIGPPGRRPRGGRRFASQALVRDEHAAGVLVAPPVGGVKRSPRGRASDSAQRR